MNKKNRLLTVLVLPVSLFCSAVRADHPSFSLMGGLAGPATTQPAETLPQGSWSVGLRVEYTDLDAIPDPTLQALSESHQHAHGVDALWSTSLALAHGLTDDLTLGLSLPYIRREDIREAAHVHGGPDEVGAFGDSEGVGDLRLYGQYRFHHQPANEAHAAAILGIKAPAGETHESAATGERFPTDLQPGSGSWDPFVGLAYSRKWADLSLHGNVLYNITTEGAQDTELGDGFFYNLALAYPLNEAPAPSDHDHDHGTHDHDHAHDAGPRRATWSLLLELNGEWHGKDETEAGKEDNTGGHVLYLAPGVRASVGSRGSASLSLGYPVLIDLNGTQSEPDLRIVATVSTAL